MNTRKYFTCKGIFNKILVFDTLSKSKVVYVRKLKLLLVNYLSLGLPTLSSCQGADRNLVLRLKIIRDRIVETTFYCCFEAFISNSKCHDAIEKYALTRQ